MSEWKCYKLNEISSLSNGINFDKSAYTSGVKLIGVSDFKNRIHPDYDSLQEVDSKVVKSGDYLEKGDIVFVRSNGNKELVGRCMMIDRDIPVTYSGFCIKLRLNDKKIFDPVFFNYLFKTRQFKKLMTGTAVGANIQNLSQSRLGSCEVNVPDIEIQKEIATILSRYDSLIENYQKQIKLLEEAAQRLYKEWFVDLHFPGYENTKIIDGVPEGWEKKLVGDVTPIKTGKKDANFGTDNGPFPFFTCAQEPIKAPSYSFDTSAVILAGNGDFNVKLYRGKFEAYQRTYVLEPTNENMLYLLYFCISENMNRLATGASGSTIKFLTKGMIESLVIIEPSICVLDSFNQIIEPIRTQEENLQSQIRLLTEARDRLLPKIMSGEIEFNFK
jgi:type I restriction enzyme S subunit